MRLAEFILANREPILLEWEEFARTCEPSSDEMGIAALRDHADGILTVIAADLTTSQDAAEQSAKSKGNAADDTSEATAAEEHGADRADSGFTVAQMVAEFRALRASVIRLWTESLGELGSGDIEQLTRFNEAIDQSLAESVVRFSGQVDRAQEISVAIMAHDLRAGLTAIQTSVSALLKTQGLDATAVTLASEIAETADRTTHEVDILLDFTRSQRGEGIPIQRVDASMGTLVREVAGDIGSAHPERQFRVDGSKEERGEWDVERIRQALTNVIQSAVQHGTPGTPVTVHVIGTEKEVHVSVHNRGKAIPRERLDTLFDLRGAARVEGTPQGRGQEELGLGLYIAERIAHAHGGSITAKSSEVHGNTFTVCLPRHAPSEER